MKIILPFAAMILALSANSALAEESPPSIEGNWKCTIGCGGCGQVVRDPRVIQDGSSLHFINECGHQAVGEYRSGRTFWVQKWGNPGTEACYPGTAKA